MAQHAAARCPVLILVILLVCVSIAVISINHQQLADSTGVCVNYGWWTDCSSYTSGCLITGDYEDKTPCNYAYSVGGISLLVQVIALILQRLPQAAVWNALIAVFNVVWWTIAASYFTKKWDEARGDPLDNWRHGLMAVCWAGVALSATQLTVCMYQYMDDRKREKAYEDRERYEQDQGINMVVYQPAAYPPPPPGAYPAPAAPPPGYPAAVPYPGAYPTVTGYPVPMQAGAYPGGYNPPAASPPGPYAGAYPPAAPQAGQYPTACQAQASPVQQGTA